MAVHTCHPSSKEAGIGVCLEFTSLGALDLVKRSCLKTNKVEGNKKTPG